MEAETKVIDLTALGTFKSLQDTYNEDKFMSREDFLDDNGLIKSNYLPTSLENCVATYSDIYGLFYGEEPSEEPESD